MDKVHVVVDASRLSRFQDGREAPMWWGIVGLLLIEGTVVASFIASYLYLRATQPPWPPDGVPLPPLGVPAAGAVLLLASCVTMWDAGRALVDGAQSRFRAMLLASVLLASGTLVLRWQQIDAFPFSWHDHAYGSMVWTITGFHFLHVLSAVLGTGVVALLAYMGFFNRQRQLAVVVDTLYWYFVAAVWVPLFAVLYGLPRWG